MLAFPSAGSDAAAAATVKAVDESHPQFAFLRFLLHFGDAQREGVKIQKQPAIANEAAPRHMTIAKDEMPARVFPGVLAGAFQDFRPVLEIGIVAVHQFDLAKMDGFASDVDVGAGQIGEQMRVSTRLTSGTDAARPH
jgi:hypothetical protein